jgi:hypothetical protein
MGYKTPRTYALNVLHAALSPADSTNYYFGNITVGAPAALWDLFKIRIPKTGRITAFYFNQWSQTATGTAEAWPIYLRLNDTTDTLLATISSDSPNRNWVGTNLNIAVTEGDYIVCKYVCPAWVTNPDGSKGGGYIFIECD